MDGLKRLVVRLIQVNSRLLQVVKEDARQMSQSHAFFAHIEEWGQAFERMYEAHMGAALGCRMHGQRPM